MAARLRATPVRVLITNQTLDDRAGRDGFAMEWARQMQARDIKVAAYTSDPAMLERFLEIDPIPVVVRPEGLSARPDLIHARNPLDAFSSLYALPGVPMVYQVVEGVWERHPPVHPRIRHYLVDSDEAAAAVAAASGFGSGRITVCPPLIDTRERTDPSAWADLVCQIYRNIIAEAAGLAPDFDGECRAAADFLSTFFPVLDETYQKLGNRWPPPGSSPGAPDRIQALS